MSDSGESILYRGMQPLLEKADAKIAELKRWARVSFSLDVRSVVKQDDITDILSLKHAPKYSRCAMEFRDYNLGELHFSRTADGTFARRDDGLYCPSHEVLHAGFWLRSVIQSFEKEPAENRELWREQSQGVPVVIDGVNYFARILDSSGKPFGNHSLSTYRTGDLESQLFLAKLSS